MSRILIVDDNEINLSMLRLLLESEDYEVEQATNGVEALEVARKQAPDLTITDVLMPEMDGFSLCRHWLADNDLRRIPLVIYTATYTEPEDMELAFGLGAVRFLVKPCVAEVMLAEVRDLLAGGGDEPMAETTVQELDEPTYYRKYSEALIRKLEGKTFQLEESNRALGRTVEHVVLQRDRMKLLTTALNEAASAIMITDQEGLIEWVNESFISLTGYSADEVRGKPCSILRSDEHDPAFFEQMWATLHDGRSWRGRLVNRRRDGSNYTEEMTIAPVRDLAGATTHYVAVKNDMTRQLEMERQQSRSQRLEALGTLSGGLAHDFSNILQAMTSLAEVMEDELSRDKPTNVSELLAENRDLIERGARLTKQLLTFSRSGRVRPKPLELNDLVTQSLDLLHRLLDDEIDLCLDLAAEALPFNGDRSQLEQLLVNLVVNGRDAMDHGGSLSIRTGADDDEWVWLEVEDCGHGIADGLEQRIFEPLFTTKPEGKGTGLGLAVVHQVVERHGGRVDVRSTSEQGSCFRVHLPKSIS